jgi:alpha-L-fucosidase
MNRKAEGIDRRKFIAGGAGLLAAAKLASGQRNSYADSNFAGGPIPGPFRPNWESLKAYRYPDWFRDAKFGIWAHWSPQCVPEQGDWYARGMYVQGNAQYNYHVKTYGHPSQFGYKDICHIWRAENWDPEELIRLYAKTGAKYFIGTAARTADVSTLHGNTIWATNTIKDPKRIVPVSSTVNIKGDTMPYSVPAYSIQVLEIELK